MLTTLTAAFPGRIIHGVGDAAFHGQALVYGKTRTMHAAVVTGALARPLRL